MFFRFFDQYSIIFIVCAVVLLISMIVNRARHRRTPLGKILILGFVIYIAVNFFAEYIFEDFDEISPSQSHVVFRAFVLVFPVLIIISLIRAGSKNRNRGNNNTSQQNTPFMNSGSQQSTPFTSVGSQQSAPFTGAGSQQSTPFTSAGTQQSAPFAGAGTQQSAPFTGAGTQQSAPFAGAGTQQSAPFTGVGSQQSAPLGVGLQQKSAPVTPPIVQPPPTETPEERMRRESELKKQYELERITREAELLKVQRSLSTVTCEYCAKQYDVALFECPGCGAKNKS